MTQTHSLRSVRLLSVLSVMAVALALETGCGGGNGTNLKTIAAFPRCDQQIDLSTARDELDGIHVAITTTKTADDAPPVVTLAFTSDKATAITTDASVNVMSFILKDNRVVAGFTVAPKGSSRVAPITRDLGQNQVVKLSPGETTTFEATADNMKIYDMCAGTTWPEIWAHAADYTVLGLVMHATPVDDDGKAQPLPDDSVLAPQTTLEAE